jgi:precorrin-8X/cobalt-precorrin-8 methylmutase
MKPQEIEQESFRIIDHEAGPHGFSPQEWQIVRRMIHTSADFDYLQTVRFHPKAIAMGLEAIRTGIPIVTDTRMAHSGIRKAELGRFGVPLVCNMDDPAIHAAARSSGSTRAAAALDAAVKDLPDAMYVIGNAPTALLRLIERVRTGEARPALIIGLPVGFVNAAESKAALAEMDYPYITNTGRKGGSNVAAAVVNALILLALEKEERATRNE